VSQNQIVKRTLAVVMVVHVSDVAIVTCATAQILVHLLKVSLWKNA
jgi:anti-anti-sigma regulatory factor